MKNHIEQAMTENELFGFKPVSVKTTPVYKGFWSWLTGKPHHYTIEASFTTDDSDPLEQLRTRIQKDSDYAWSIYSKLAMSMFDRISEAVDCELNAAKIMSRIFNVDMTTHPKYPIVKPESIAVRDLLKTMTPIPPTHICPEIGPCPYCTDNLHKLVPDPIQQGHWDVNGVPQPGPTPTTLDGPLSPVKQFVELIDHGKTGLLFREFRRRMGVELEDFSDPTLNSEQPCKSTYNREFVTKLEAGDARWTEDFFKELIELTGKIAKLKSTVAY